MKTCFPITFLGFFDGTPFLLGKTYKRAGDEHISIYMYFMGVYILHLFVVFSYLALFKCFIDTVGYKII